MCALELVGCWLDNLFVYEQWAMDRLLFAEIRLHLFSGGKEMNEKLEYEESLLVV